MKANDPSLPRLLVWIIDNWCDSRTAEYLLGDLHEMYVLRIQSTPRLARILIFYDFLSLLFHGVLQPSFKLFFNIMILRNYLKVATRTLLKQRVHSSINIIGLSIGLAISLMITLFVVNEISYDRFHERADRIYLLPMTWNFGGTEVPTGYNCSAGGPFMKEAFPQVETFVRLTPTSRSFYKGDVIVKEENGAMADSTFFSVFSFPLIAGTEKQALVEPNSIVLSKTLAQKYFGENWNDAINKTLRDTNGKQYVITGVVQDIPRNSHIRFEYLISMSSIPGAEKSAWDNSQFMTYLLINRNASIEEILPQIPAAQDEKYEAGTSEVVRLDVVPLKDVYLFNQAYPLPNTSDIFYVRIFSIIAIMVLIIATVNYINLSTSRSLERALEVGVRKVMGAQKKQLFFQFMTESFVVTGLSFMLALGLVAVLLPFFNFIANKSLSLNILMSPTNMIILMGCAFGISVLAGVYPAMVLSGYNPIRVMKGRYITSSSGARLRKSLVVMQFGISIILIICTLTVSSQMQFIKDIPVGYQKDKLVSIGLDSLSRTRINLFKDAVSSEPAIHGVASSTQLPIRITYETKINVKGGSEETYRLIKVWGTDQDFIKTTGLTLLHGNEFSEHHVDDEWQVILNETALSFFGWTAEEAIDKEVTFWQSTGRIKGIVKDFYFSSAHNTISPLVIFTGADKQFHNMLVVNSSAPPKETISILEKHWKKINPDAPFVLNFADERYAHMYENETRLGHIVNIFAALAILISGLGLFGLASYTIAQRTKELGVRKVLGASIHELIIMVSKDFVKLVLFAFILAIPVSYYFMQEWLARFAYRVDFSWLLVAISGLLAFLIAACTVSYHSLQVARNNPVDSLRNE